MTAPLILKRQNINITKYFVTLKDILSNPEINQADACLPVK